MLTQMEKDIRADVVINNGIVDLVTAKILVGEPVLVDYGILSSYYALWYMLEDDSVVCNSSIARYVRETNTMITYYDADGMFLKHLSRRIRRNPLIVTKYPGT